MITIYNDLLVCCGKGVIRICKEYRIVSFQNDLLSLHINLDREGISYDETQNRLFVRQITTENKLE